MKKLVISLVFLASVLTGCNNTSTSNSDEFVGTYVKEHRGNIIISNQNNGYIVQMGENKYNADLKNNILTFDFAPYGKTSITLESEQIIFDGYQYKKQNTN